MKLEYLKQFTNLAEQLNQHGFEIDLEVVGGKFKSKHTSTMYVMFHLEKVRVNKVSVEIMSEFNKCMDEMYILGMEPIVTGKQIGRASCRERVSSPV